MKDIIINILEIFSITGLIAYLILGAIHEIMHKKYMRKFMEDNNGKEE